MRRRLFAAVGTVAAVGTIAAVGTVAAVGAVAAVGTVGGLAGCSGGGQHASVRADDAAHVTPVQPRAVGAVADGGIQAVPGAAAPYRVAKRGSDGAVAGAGGVAIRVVWPGVPARLVTSPGRNACKLPLPSPVSQHHMGGIRGAFVWLENVATGRAPLSDTPAQIAVRGCTPTPGTVALARLGGSLEIVSDDERRHTVTIEHLGDGTEAAEPLHKVPMPLVGQRFTVRLTRPGIVRVGLAARGSSHTYVHVPRHPYHAVTDRRGEVVFDQVPAGAYTVVVWHPPVVSAGPARIVRTPAVVTAGAVIEVSVSLSQ